jgi:hypothetical protein
VSTSAPPPASLSNQRNLRPWYLILAMISSWFIGVFGLSDAFAKVMFLRDNTLPDITNILRELADETEPVSAVLYLFDASYMRALADVTKLAFPLFLGKLILSIVLVISSAMAMSGRPGSRSFAIQAHLAYAALSVASFWLLRGPRYAAIDAVQHINASLSTILPLVPTNAIEACRTLFDKPWLIWGSRIQLAIFGVGGLLMGAIVLMTPKTKAFFDAVAAATDETEDL